jgi:two-component system, NarL family, nitrate/nitrite response regulator NarL
MSHRSPPIRVLLIDVHALVRAGLRLLLESQPGLTVVAEAANATEALVAAARERPDIILLDVDRGNDQDLTLLPELLSATPGTRVLILTDGRDAEVHQHAVRLGVMGLVVKESPPADLIHAIEKVYRGEVWFGPTLLARVLIALTRRDEPKAPTLEAIQIATLTARERQVVTLIGEGLKNQQLAARLCISEATVRHHLTSIFAKLRVTDRFELALYAYRHGLAQPPCSCAVGD